MPSFLQFARALSCGVVLTSMALPGLAGAQDAGAAPPKAQVTIQHSSAAGDTEWRSWAQQYLAGVRADESVANIEAHGKIGNGIDAIDAAREIWAQVYGAEQVAHQEPYRSYRKNNLWLVASHASKGQLGQGLILVIDRDTGRVLRVAGGK